MSTITDDRCTDMILDFIAGGVPGNPSGESSGNYNAYFGNPKSAKDLGARSLDGIYAIQDEMLAADPRSTAVGRYQFLRGTLQSLQKKFKLPGTALFTSALQDKFAVELLVGRGYSAWWRGQLGNAEFLNRLSLEWASLPDPENGGKSHYDGDSAGNHASTTLAAVYAMLTAARAAQSVPVVVAAPVEPPAPAPAVPDGKRVQAIAAELAAIGERMAA